MSVNGVEIRKKGEDEWDRLGALVQLDVDEQSSRE
jgi:hypothetical protein